MLVSDLFQLDLFPDFRLIGGAKGLDRMVKTVMIFDAPDMSYWIRGGEFLMGNGYIFKDDPRGFVRFMREVAEKEVVLLGLKFDRFILLDDMMEEVRAEADRLGLPVAQIPFRYGWTEIIEKCFHEINHSSTNTALLHLGGQGIEREEDMQTLLVRLAGDLQRSIFLRSKKHDVSQMYAFPFPFADPVRGEKYFRQSPRKEMPFPGLGSIAVCNEVRDFEGYRRCVAYSTTSSPFFEVHITLKDGENRLARVNEQKVLRGLASLRVLFTEKLLAQDRAVEEIEDMVSRMILGAHVDQRRLEELLRTWKRSLALPCQVAVQSGKGNEGDYDAWKEAFGGISCRLGDLHVGILPSGRLEKTDLARLVSMSGEPLALGPSAEAIGGIGNSFREAKGCLAWLKRRHRKAGVYSHGDVLIDMLVERFSGEEEIGQLWARYWKPLKKSRGYQAIPLEQFARELILSNFNLRICSERLCAHYNTARNYQRVLEKRLNISLENEKDRFALSFASRADPFMDNELEIWPYTLCPR